MAPMVSLAWLLWHPRLTATSSSLTVSHPVTSKCSHICLPDCDQRAFQNPIAVILSNVKTNASQSVRIRSSREEHLSTPDPIKPDVSIRCIILTQGKGPRVSFDLKQAATGKVNEIYGLWHKGSHFWRCVPVEKDFTFVCFSFTTDPSWLLSPSTPSYHLHHQPSNGCVPKPFPPSTEINPR